MAYGESLELQSQQGRSTTKPAPPLVNREMLDVSGTQGDAKVLLPRVTIKYCTQCKWMLRAAYYAQELLQTFSMSLGEVALIPATGGAFTVSILSALDSAAPVPEYKETILWDRKTENGFPGSWLGHKETKQLKALVRDVIDPSRNLGHIDRSLKKSHQTDKGGPPTTETEDDGEKQRKEQEACEDCQ
ncbi:hypothetical protein KEM54_000943 [Ascosphaera aggregata]|nr:hypothetical protein KEM54_000943 [Ascosphaera aggregata]